MTKPEKTAFRMLQEITMRQINEEITDENIEDMGLCEECMDLIYENDSVYIVNYGENMTAGYCNIIRKDGELIETVELA